MRLKNGGISTYQKDKDEYLTECGQRTRPRTIEDFLLQRDEAAGQHGEEKMVGLEAGRSPVQVWSYRCMECRQVEGTHQIDGKGLD